MHVSKWDGISLNMWKYSIVNPLKSDKVLIPLHNLFFESIHKNKGNDQQLRQLLTVFYKFSLLEPRKYIENSIESMHNNVRV